MIVQFLDLPQKWLADSLNINAKNETVLGAVNQNNASVLAALNYFFNHYQHYLVPFSVKYSFLELCRKWKTWM
jgi:hypothetical protein